jgi:transcriptional regulator GlxA family with amidase domain
MQTAILLYPGLTALDAIGPYDVLSRLPGMEMVLVAARTGEHRTDQGTCALVADATLDEVTSPEIVVVPGGFGVRALLDDADHLDWVRDVHAQSAWTTSVCTGSLLLGAAGLLDGLDATTHWAAYDTLASYGANPTSARVVEVGRIITAAGVSSGIDMALHLCARLQGDEVAQAIQLSIEYDPQPPFDTGSPAKAPPALVEMLRGIVAEREAAHQP